MNDAITEITDEDEDSESEEIVEQTLEEIGIDLSASLATVPRAKDDVTTGPQKVRTKKVAVAEGVGPVSSRAAPAPADDDDGDDDVGGDPGGDDEFGDLEARLNALKK